MKRLTVRLSKDTLNGIKKLKSIYEDEYHGLKMNQGYVVYKAYLETQGSNWLDVKNKNLKLNNFEINDIEEYNNNDSRTTLDLNDEVIETIKEMQRNLPGLFGGKRINTGYCIKLIVKAALLKQQNEDSI